MPVPIPPYAADPSQLIVGSPIDPATYLTPYTGPPPPKPPIAPPPASTVAALQGRAGGPFLPGAIPGVPGVPVRTDVRTGGAAAGQGRGAQQPPAGAAATPYGYDPGPQLRAAEQERAAQEKRAADLRTNAQRLIGEIPPAWNLDNPLETQAQLKRAQAALDESQSAYAAALKHMPQKPEVDSIAHFGGLATIVGLLAGAFSRRPLTASLNAAGAAMESYNQGDLRNYKMSVDQWKMQTDYLLSIAKMNESALSSIIARTDLSERQRLDRLKILSQVLGMGDVANEAQVKGLSAYADRIGDIAKVRAELAKAQATQEQANAYREATLGIRSRALELQPKAQQQQEINDAVSRDDTQFRSDFTKTNGRPPNDTEMADAHSKHFEARSREILAAASTGRQQAQQLTAITSAGNEAVAALNNLVELPLTANMGVFGGAQFRTPDDLSAALRRSLVRGVTPAEVSELRASFAGVQRALATLEAAGRATGLVGLSEQMTALMPQSGDTPLVILRKYAEIRQIIERSMETVKSTAAIPPSQVTLLDKITAEAKKAVPYTVHDVNALERGPNDPGTVRAFANRVFDNQRGVGALPTVTNQAQYDALPPGSDYLGPDGHHYHKAEKQ